MDGTEQALQILDALFLAEQRSESLMEMVDASLMRTPFRDLRAACLLILKRAPDFVLNEARPEARYSSKRHLALICDRFVARDRFDLVPAVLPPTDEGLREFLRALVACVDASRLGRCVLALEAACIQRVVILDATLHPSVMGTYKPFQGSVPAESVQRFVEIGRGAGHETGPILELMRARVSGIKTPPALLRAFRDDVESAIRVLEHERRLSQAAPVGLVMPAP